MQQMKLVKPSNVAF